MEVTSTLPLCPPSKKWGWGTSVWVMLSVDITTVRNLSSIDWNRSSRPAWASQTEPTPPSRSSQTVIPTVVFTTAPISLSPVMRQRAYSATTAPASRPQLTTAQPRTPTERTRAQALSLVVRMGRRAHRLLQSQRLGSLGWRWFGESLWVQLWGWSLFGRF